ncbi:hypothetical protein [Paenibacillus sp. Z3-2]
MKLLKSKKFFSGILCLVLSITPLGGAISASSNLDNSDIPKGFEVLREYDLNDKNSIREIPAKIITDLQDKNKNSIFSGTDSNVLSEVEVTKNETRIYRDLKNIETGEIQHQYVTTSTVEVSPLNDSEIITPFFDNGGDKTDSSQSVRLTVRIFWHENSTDSNYIGMDKAYYRWDQLDSQRISIPSYTGTAKQIGPGVNNKVQMNGLPVNGTHPISGETYLITFDRLGWIDVLAIGVGTQVGIHFTTNLQRSEDSKWSFNFGMVIFGSNTW